MSIGFNWFKTYEIKKEEYGVWIGDEYRIKYIGGNSTSHSGGNIAKVQDLIEKYSNGKRIPTVHEDWIDSIDYKIDGLIEPKEMSKICCDILNGAEVDKCDMRNRIEWFKKLSDNGYYMTYDSM